MKNVVTIGTEDEIVEVYLDQQDIESDPTYAAYIKKYNSAEKVRLVECKRRHAEQMKFYEKWVNTHPREKWKPSFCR